MCDYVRRGSECEPKYGKLWEGVQILGRRGEMPIEKEWMDGQEWLN